MESVRLANGEFELVLSAETITHKSRMQKGRASEDDTADERRFAAGFQLAAP